MSCSMNVFSSTTTNELLQPATGEGSSWNADLVVNRLARVNFWTSAVVHRVASGGAIAPPAKC